MKVRILRDAREDIDVILAELRDVSPQGAASVAARLTKAFAVLSDQPRSGRPTGKPNLYRVPLTPHPYIIFYRLAHEAVEIVGLRHGARNPRKMPDG